MSTSDTNLKHVPLLLRAFRKKTEASGALCHNASRMGALHALSPGPQAIDVWAPMAVMHVVRALAVTGTGLQFQGPVVCHQHIHSRPVLVDGRQHLVARRAQTPVSGSPPLQTMINWKVKYTLPVTYPGNQSDSVQIAWESDEPVETPYSLDLVDDARSRGLLIQNFVPLGPPQPGYILMDPLSPFQLKIHWTGGTPPPKIYPDHNRACMSKYNGPREDSIHRGKLCCNWDSPCHSLWPTRKHSALSPCNIRGPEHPPMCLSGWAKWDAPVRSGGSR